MNDKTKRGSVVRKTHPDVTVDDEADAEQAIEERGERARGREGGAGERDEAGGEQTLESPVVRSVRPVRGGESRRFVRGALVDRYCKIKRPSLVVNTAPKGGKMGDVRPPGT